MKFMGIDFSSFLPTTFRASMNASDTAPTSANLQTLDKRDQQQLN